MIMAFGFTDHYKINLFFIDISAQHIPYMTQAMCTFFFSNHKSSYMKAFPIQSRLTGTKSGQVSGSLLQVYLKQWQ
jgi:hypothetical protein